MLEAARARFLDVGLGFGRVKRVSGLEECESNQVA